MPTQRPPRLPRTYDTAYVDREAAGAILRSPARRRKMANVTVTEGAPHAVSDETRARADELKRQGNEALAHFKFAAAVELYSEAIALVPTAIFYANRAAAHVKSESYGLAIDDASAAIELEPSYIKGPACLSPCSVALCARGDADAGGVIAVLQLVDPSYDGPHLPDDLTQTKPDFIVALMDRFKRGKLLHRKFVIQILLKLKEMLCALPSLLRISLPTDDPDAHFTVCGDTHGQFYDVCNIFSLNGLPSETNPYLFNGDFVDRGSFSFEVVMTLFAMKLVYPQHVHLLRGNHESKNMNKIYGFEGEVKHKYDETVMQLFTEVFNWLPLAAVIEDRVLVVHGGLFNEENVTLPDIEKIDRNREPPESGLMSDLMWSDPQPFQGRGPSKRGIGLSFGPDITKAFLAYNNLGESCCH
ncbi:unnamed protein product [Phytophthora fragariaefolia]|uniref:Serine/threonine-protein phosphatase n=1 Tax=Phytophthora fragariaefolia TaxID=1490495 RepID=A0A9W6WV23_9STRA|nr:unnamed protein product [Phytophthora fragariaefolia]